MKRSDFCARGLDCGSKDFHGTNDDDDDGDVRTRKRAEKARNKVQQTYPPSNTWFGRSDVTKWSATNEKAMAMTIASVRESEEYVLT